MKKKTLFFLLFIICFPEVLFFFTDTDIHIGDAISGILLKAGTILLGFSLRRIIDGKRNNRQNR